jgi:hypothetical protein
MIAIGNPPSDDEGSWFEGLCTTNGVEVIRISAYSTPAFTDERVGLCRSCPPEVAAHSLAIHLVQRFQVDEAVAERGEDSPWVQAKVHARFPKGGSSRVIPSDWVDAAMDVEEPEGEEFVRLSDLGLQSEQAGWMVERGAWVRLGVDVAADGGDEFVIGRAVGDLGTVEHVAAGLANAKSTDVAGVILQQIRRAQLLRQALGTPNKVRVKIDVIGVGWGVYGLLKAWGSEGLHDAEIVKVDVRENTYRKGMDDVMRPYRKRDEMWVAGRHLVQPGLRGGTGRIRLRVDARVASQLASPSSNPRTPCASAASGRRTARRRCSWPTTSPRTRARAASPGSSSEGRGPGRAPILRRRQPGRTSQRYGLPARGVVTLRGLGRRGGTSTSSSAGAPGSQRQIRPSLSQSGHQPRPHAGHVRHCSCPGRRATVSQRR